MGVLEIIGGILIVAFAIIVIAAVTMQEGSKGNGLSALGGGDNGSFSDKNRGKTKEAMLVRATTICGTALVVVVVVVLAATL